MKTAIFAIARDPACNIRSSAAPRPCVGFITPDAYNQDVRDTELFLEGKASDVVERWIHKMEAGCRATGV